MVSMLLGRRRRGCSGEHLITAFTLTLTTYLGVREQQGGRNAQEHEQAECQRPLAGVVSNLVSFKRVPVPQSVPPAFPCSHRRVETAS